jgi:CheY-like chemotaxis protein
VTGPQRILVVDDNDDLRENIAECLTDEGFSVAAVADGRRALEHLAAEPLPGLVIVDMMMPGMTGPELVTLIRSERRLDGVRLLLSSGATPPRGAVAAVDAVLVKPFGVAALLATVRQLLQA